MNYSVRWKDCHKSDSVENYLQEKMSKFFDFNFVQDNLKAEIVFYPKTKEYTVRINVSVPTKGVIRAEDKSYDVITSINECCNKIIDQLRRVKTQFKDKG